MRWYSFTKLLAAAGSRNHVRASWRSEVFSMKVSRVLAVAAPDLGGMDRANVVWEDAG